MGIQNYGGIFSGANTVVTGGTGFIGSHLATALVGLGARVTVIDNLSGSNVSNIEPLMAGPDPKLRFVQASILDREVVAEAMAGVQYVFHQAAMGSVPRSLKYPQRYHDVNTTGTLNILEAARAARVKRVMFAASSSAYGDTPTLPKVETMPSLPRSPYAATKVAGEALLRAYATSYSNGESNGKSKGESNGAGGAGFDTVSLRYFNIFGPRQNANSAYAAVIAAFAKALLNGEPPVIHGDGEQSRDFTYVDNAVHANLLAAASATPLRGEVFNVACGERVTVNELAAQMAEALGRPDLVARHVESRAGDVKHSLADLAKIRAGLGFEPRVRFGDGLKATMDWYAGDFKPGADGVGA